MSPFVQRMVISCILTIFHVQFTFSDPTCSNCVIGSDTARCGGDKTCNIECIGDQPCQFWDIHCYNGAICNITCDGPQACRQSTINATDASSLSITASGGQSTQDISVYCPNNGPSMFLMLYT